MKTRAVHSSFTQIITKNYKDTKLTMICVNNECTALGYFTDYLRKRLDILDLKKTWTYLQDKSLECLQVAKHP